MEYKVNTLDDTTETIKIMTLENIIDYVGIFGMNRTFINRKTIAFKLYV